MKSGVYKQRRFSFKELNMNKEDIKVDFDHSILALSNSILRHYNIRSEYKTLDTLDEVLAENFKNVAFLILDCLGKNIIERHLPPHSFLRSHVCEYISTIFPPTTAAATITFHSGLPPIKSGWLGWMNYFPQYGRVVENFCNVDFYTGEKLSTPHPAETVLKYESIYEKITKQNPDVEYHRIFPAFIEGGAETFAEMCERIAQTAGADNKRKIISAYWTEPDHTIHYNGVASDLTHEVVGDINRQVEKLAAELKDSVIIISADHGAVDVEEKIINEHPDLCDTLRLPPTIETRIISFFVKEGQNREFERLFKQYYGKEFVLFEKQEFLKAHILGYGEPHPMVEGFLGDYIAIATGKLSLNYDSGLRELKLFKATHAGYSKEEMTVPLIVIKCK